MTLRFALGAIPFIMTGLGLFWPAINGPNLWFGFPSLIVWISLCVIVCTLVLIAYDRHAGAVP
jgi:membrane protein required for beta-lactamase induction